MPPRGPLKPGQVRLSGLSPQGKRPARFSHGGGGLAALLLLVLGLVVLKLLDVLPSRQLPEPSSPASSSVPESPPASSPRPVTPVPDPLACASMNAVELAFSANCAVPNPPDYPGRYAAFIPRRSAGPADGGAQADAWRSAALVFSYENLNVIAVASLAAIPAAERQSARFAADSSQGLWADSSVPFILFGPVDLEVGPLVGSTELETALLASHGDLKAVQMVYGGTRAAPPAPSALGSLSDLAAAPESARPGFEAAPARGPPRQHPAARKVYVVGQINEFKGPEEFDRSALAASVFDLDLGPDEAQLAEYNGRMEHWRDVVARGFGIPRLELSGVNRVDQVETLRRAAAEVRSRNDPGGAKRRREEQERIRRRAEEREGPRELAP